MVFINTFQVFEVQLKMCCVICIGHLTEYFRLFPKYFKGFPTVLFGERTIFWFYKQGYVLRMDAGSTSFTCKLFIAYFQDGFSCLKCNDRSQIQVR